MNTTPGSSLIPFVDEDVALYFGTWQEAGHYLFKPGMVKSKRDRDDLAKYLDSGRWQPSGKQGEAKITHLQGWTVLSFADRSVDRRGGSHSTFVLKGEHDFATALDLARAAFPQVFERFDFEIVEVVCDTRSRSGHHA